jgi:hypothetical protein
MSGKNNTNNPPPPQTSDDGGRGGIKFGTEIVYDDAYMADAGLGQGDDRNAMMTSLSTLDEERRMMMDDDDIVDEEYDEGRVIDDVDPDDRLDPFSAGENGGGSNNKSVCIINQV